MRHELETKGWSQADLVRATNLDKRTVSTIIGGKQREMSVGNFFVICDALGLDPLFVWTGMTAKQRRKAKASEPPPARSVSSRPPPVSSERPSRPARG